jgi:Mrp family chromosome partitioning ATPase
MKTLLQDLSRSFDLVLLDAGPVLGTSDTRHLCRLADRTVFAVKWQDTLCSGAALGLRQLADAGATIAGTVLTMVDQKSYRKFSPVHEYRRRPAIYLNP